MARRAALISFAVIFATAVGLFEWRQARRDLSCLASAKRADFFVFFLHPDSSPIRLRFRFGPDAGTITRDFEPGPIASGSADEVRKMALELLAPLSRPPPPDLPPPSTELSVELSCDGGLPRARHLYSSEYGLQLRDCWHGVHTEPRCLSDWWTQSHPWSWREHDERVVEVGYNARALLSTLEQAHALRVHRP